MTSKQHMIQKGINYLRLLRTMDIEEISDQFNESTAHIRDCVRAAREQKEASFKKPRVTLGEQPYVKVYKNLSTGQFQNIKGVSVRLPEQIVIKYSEEPTSTFTFMAPIEVTVVRDV